MTVPEHSSPPPVRNDLFDKTRFDRGRPKTVEMTWYLIKVIFFLSAWPWPVALKVRLLRAFGCSVGAGLVIRPRVNIHFPWKLEIGDHCWIGERTEILNLERVVLGDHSALAHDVYLAAAGHDSSSRSMAYKNEPIHIGRSVWVTTRAFVGPGVTVGDGAVIGPGAVVLKDVAPNSVMAGNPATVVGERRITRP